MQASERGGVNASLKGLRSVVCRDWHEAEQLYRRHLVEYAVAAKAVRGEQLCVLFAHALGDEGTEEVVVGVAFVSRQQQLQRPMWIQKLCANVPEDDVEDVLGGLSDGKQ